MKKVYILKRASGKLIDDYRREFSDELRKKIDKRIDPTKPLILIEKTANKDNTESYTNMWLIDEGVESLWTIHTKGNIIYDYTAVSTTLVHVNGEILTFKQYSNK